MSKELTDKWKNETLSLNYYYIKLQSGKYGIDHTVMSIDGDLPKTKFAYSNFAIEEVLAPVPSYTELTLMAGNYRLAKKALRDCYNEMKYWTTMNHRCSKIFNHIKEALVEIEEVK